ncbi:hypothetical protein SAMN05421640_1223 [Ekhidna lutea]|uniref:Uncharacterized protein n=1 Tax=Ekhidna lutea TaxID=447679 RepID=A0A239HAF7_EKHLU|nr:hypothetical protein [Ekhidna lutea]SNS78357.1 hypothetical protein SAMN05421640_1223 [Ekhidna lutea]
MIKDTKRQEIAEWVLQADDDVLLLLDQLRKSETSDWWDGLSESQQKRIQKGYKSIIEGKSMSHEEVAKKHGL